MIAFSDADRAHMARALAFAENGLYTTTPNPRVGCVIVENGEVIGEGWHRARGRSARRGQRARGCARRGDTIRAARRSTRRSNPAITPAARRRAPKP